MTDVQTAVDALAAELGCPVLVEDARHQPLWWSAHSDADPVRLKTLLERSVAPEAADMVSRLDLPHATGPIRTPEVPEIGMRERWCLPLRRHGEHLGYLWIVDGDATVHASMLERLQTCADAASAAMAGIALSSAERWRRRSALLDRLARGRDEEAAGDLIALDHLPYDVRVVVCSPAVAGGWPLHDVSVHVADDSAPSVATSGEPLALVDLAEAVRRARTTERCVRAGARLAAPTWSALGAWRLVVEADPATTPADLHPGVEAVLALGREDLLLTARAVLDHGGDVAAAAEELHIHRTTLYYRLDRIRDATGIDLRAAEQRTDVQLGLALAAYRAAGPADGRAR